MSEKDNKAKSVVSEDDGTDPITLTNFILAHDARQTGFNWTRYLDHEKTEEDVFADAQDAAFEEDEYVLDEAKKKKKVKKMKKSKSKKRKKTRKPVKRETSPVATQEEPTASAEPSTQQPIERNSEDPNVFSTNPEINRCPAFINGVCRVDGRPCPFDNMDYRDCGKYRLASSGKPELFEVPPGRESAPEYLLGIKS